MSRQRSGAHHVGEKDRDDLALLPHEPILGAQTSRTVSSPFDEKVHVLNGQGSQLGTACLPSNAMRRLIAVPIGLLLAFAPVRVAASSAWGSPGYGDPPGWCTNLSDMWVADVVTNDPYVGTNPEQNTFYGFHPNPGYDDWYGYFYGDFRGSPGDASGWIKLLHENYPSHHYWNFATNGWAVHGHAKE
jgi:hypothetical protein